MYIQRDYIAMYKQVIKRKYYTGIVKKQCRKCGENLCVNHLSNVTYNTIIKNNVNFNGMKIVGAGIVIIGNYFHSGTDCMMLTSNHDYDTGKEIPYDAHRSIHKNIVIEDFVWLGSRVLILPGVRIGEGVIVQAGSVVSSDIPAYAIAGGNPARVFKYRDIEHFKKLKKEKKWF